ncbi:UDP-glucose 4-epimerase GalE [Bradyrhizobium sp. CCGB12]|uniref:UDP-glucose 4-epimerase GalE n=1 Tax=Bradyrhizobium sp. CCGB12 TaxID=2949632 RepID=UPI0020B17B0E|nr:UDP-glucose 4-epimerase GalE [Bradyrhizobium sp. CCGB12]MCP3392315.1 UDP-glucose 4-epimerase GalE [Bradyrhizobium sp. CCGB12]
MIMVTGGAGYIGSHVCIALLDAGFDVVVVDNLSNSKRTSLDRVQAICGKSISFKEADLRDEEAILRILREFDATAVVHLAGLKAVGESHDNPIGYYDNNFVGTLRLVSAMKTASVKKLIFSSSATVYGSPSYLPIDEDHSLAPTNPYGRTKYFIEEMLRDLHGSDNDWSIAILRYFNPVGAHESGRIGEDPSGIPNNLLPLVAQVAIGKRKQLVVLGNDYPTHDGTGIRDFIHVVDLASGHLSALNHLTGAGILTANLGTGRGTSVLEIVQAFESASGSAVPHTIGDRRAGDVAACYADPTLAADLLGWKSTKTLAQMCADHWRWQSNNPNGYHPPRRPTGERDAPT